jgi:hypothetical protein
MTMMTMMMTMMMLSIDDYKWNDGNNTAWRLILAPSLLRLEINRYKSSQILITIFLQDAVKATFSALHSSPDHLRRLKPVQTSLLAQRRTKKAHRV